MVKSRTDLELKRLRADIADAVDLPAMESCQEHPPPFSTAELVVIAAVCWCEAEMTRFGVLRAILKYVGFYGRLAIEGYVEIHEEPFNHGRLRYVVPCFDDAFNTYDLPFHLGENEEKGTVIDFRRNSKVQHFKILPQASRILLSRLLEKGESKTIFPFLKLPAEIRNSLRDASTEKPAEKLELAVFRRREDTLEPGELDDPAFDRREWPNVRLNHTACNWQLLRVYKQIYQEAMPLFFSLNRFRCAEIMATVAILDRLGSERFKHVRNISPDLTRFSSSYHDVLSRLPEALTAFERTGVSLKTLELAVNDEEWLRMRPTERAILGRKSRIFKFEQLPIFATLVHICARAETVQFKGKCEKLEWCMWEHIGKIKEAAASPADVGAKKRGKKATKGRQGHA